MTLYTLVQHSAWTAKQDPQFERAVESHVITTKDAERIKRAGGMVFESYGDAEMAAEEENYPPGVLDLIPAVRGTFARINGVLSPIYLTHAHAVVEETA